jgi:membrane protein required for colicin V production
MNLLDLGIVIILALVVLRGYYRGLFQEMALLAGLIGGLLAAAHFYMPAGAKIQLLIHEPTYSRWIAFALILVTVYWLTRLLAHLLQRLLYHLYLDIFDRLLGGVFAFLKGALILGFALMIVSLALPANSQLLRESRTAPVLLGVFHRTLQLLPSEFKARWEKQLHDWLKPKEEQQAALYLGAFPGKDDFHG